jgi:hypothetical protein
VIGDASALFFDKTNVAAALKPRDFDFVDIFGRCIQPQILFKIVFGNEMVFHCLPVYLPVINEPYVVTLN